MTTQTSRAAIAAMKASKGLNIEEPLIFEQGAEGRIGVDLPPIPEKHKSFVGNLRRKEPIGLPDLSEPQVVRHYTRLSQKNFGIDSAFYPLGSCTMKHNPRLNEKVARMPGFADIHPFQPPETIQGALEVMEQLSFWLKTLTGLPVVALSPGAGAHGEFCGLAAIKSAHIAKGEKKRKRVLVPEFAHGTNPATAASLGFTVDTIPANNRGRVDVEALRAKLGPDVAALMLTNPNTCGLFEFDMTAIAGLVHKAGAYFYCDGANFNAIVGRVRPVDLGIDVMHINLHKTFSTPHGGGGPGAGPVVMLKELEPFVPLPYIIHEGEQMRLIEHSADVAGRKAIGRIKGFHGQMGMFVRALTYMLSHGADGLWQVAGDAVLNANYILASLKDVMSAPFDGPCMHEALFDDRFLAGTNVSTADMAKALIDRGIHPMTMYFPLVVHGAFLIEPTETETKETLDAFIEAMRDLVKEVKKGKAEEFHAAPRYTPRRRLDETKAARQPVLTWKPSEEDA